MSGPTAQQISEGHGSFVAAFFAMQQDLPEVKKTSEADAGARGIMHYANLKTVTDAVYPVLAKYGFIWSCQPTVVSDKPVLRYELTHISHTEDDPQQRTGFYPIFGDNKPQEFGAAITYGRRYALCAVVGLTPDIEADAEGKAPGRTVSRKTSAKAEPADPDAVSRGAGTFQANCASCHGIVGRGGGPVVAPGLVTLAAGNGGRFPAQYVVGVVEGHGRNPAFSAVMPEFGGSGMGTGPVVDVPGVDRPVSAPLADLLAYLGSIQD